MCIFCYAHCHYDSNICMYICICVRVLDAHTHIYASCNYVQHIYAYIYICAYSATRIVTMTVIYVCIYAYVCVFLDAHTHIYTYNL